SDLATNGQKPFAIVLTCSDSRSPAEIIFDQGLGDLFVIRVAGNVVAPSLLASIEFAASEFNTPVVVVLGHSQCGALKATLANVRNPRQPLSSSLSELIGRVRPSVEIAIHDCGNNPADDKEILAQATEENVRRSMQIIFEQSKIVRERVRDGRLVIEGAVLDISNGQVNYLNSGEEVTACTD
ncbi:MAG: carbonic anhydrase, partial [Proteobacteria bacterium]